MAREELARSARTLVIRPAIENMLSRLLVAHGRNSTFRMLLFSGLFTVGISSVLLASSKLIETRDLPVASKNLLLPVSLYLLGGLSLALAYHPAGIEIEQIVPIRIRVVIARIALAAWRNLP